MKSEKQLITEIQNNKNVKQNMKKLWLQYQPLINKMAHRMERLMPSNLRNYDDLIDFKQEAYFVLKQTVESIDINRIDDNFHIVVLFKNRLKNKTRAFFKDIVNKRGNFKIYHMNAEQLNISTKDDGDTNKLNSEEYVFQHSTNNRDFNGNDYTLILRNAILKYFSKGEQKKLKKFIEMRLDGLGIEEYEDYRKNTDVKGEWKSRETCYQYLKNRRDHIKYGLSQEILNNVSLTMDCSSKIYEKLESFFENFYKGIVIDEVSLDNNEVESLKML